MKRRKKYNARVFRDSWSLDVAFYKWFLPRLKCYRDNTDGWPEVFYKTFEEFIADLDEKIIWVEFLCKTNSARKDERVSREDIDALFDEAMNDKFYPGDWRAFLNHKPFKVKIGDYKKSWSEEESLYIRKQTILEAVLAYALGEWLVKILPTLWW